MNLSACLFASLSLMVALSTLGSPLRNPALATVTPGPAAAHEPIVLVSGGVARFAFEVAGGARAEKARKALAEAFAQAGVTFPEDAGAPRLVFRLSDSGSATNEAFRVATFGGGVEISGQTLWGAADFMERFLGARFYYAGIDGEVHPRVRDLTLEPLAYTDRPRMRNRGGWPVEGSVNLKEMSHTLEAEITRDDWLRWRERNRAFNSSSFTIMHEPEPTRWSSFYTNLIPNLVETSFFRRSDCKVFHNFSDHMGNYFDVTSETFVENLIKTYRHYYSLPKNDYAARRATGFRYLTDEYIVFGQADTEPQLHEMQARDLVKRERLVTDKNVALGEAGWFSDVYAWFYTRLANRLKEEFPGKKLIVMPYHTYTCPPTQERFYPLPDNIEVGVCLGSVPRFVTNRAACEEARARLAGWVRALGGRPVQETWGYASGNNVFVQACAFNYEGAFIREMGPLLGDIGIFQELTPMSSKFPGDSVQALFHWEVYVMERQFWDPDFDVRAALDEYFDLMYGPAAEALKGFYRDLSMAYEKFAAANRDPNQLFPPKVLNDLANWLDAADKAAASATPQERARLKRFARPFRQDLKAQRGRHAFVVPQTRAGWLDGAVEIDGDGNELAWREAPEATIYRTDGSGDAPAFPPSVRLLWKDDGIYGWIVQTNAALKTQGSLWQNDTVEFIVAPGLGKERYYQIAFDAQGRVFTNKRVLKPIPQPSDRTWSAPGLKSRTREVGSGWAVEFFVPFSAYETPAPKPYASWNYLVTYTKLLPPREMVSTSVTLGNNLVLERYGTLKFMGRRLRPSDAPPFTATRKYRGYRENDHVYEASVLLKNDAGFYGMELMTYKPDKNGETDTFFFLSSPRYRGGFGSSSCRFLRMKVNGIALKDIYPEPDALKTSPAGNPAWHLDFDGAGVVVEASRRPGDPLLYLTFRRAAESVCAVSNACVSLECFVSDYDKAGRYDRFCRTARRTLGMTDAQRRSHAITADDRQLLLADHVLDGRAPDRGYGPSFILLPDDWQGIARCELELPKSYWAGVRFLLKPDFAPFTVGILQTQRRVSNDEYEGLIRGIMSADRNGGHDGTSSRRPVPEAL